MKSTTSVQSSAFFAPAFPMTSHWQDTNRRNVRPAPRVPLRFALDTDELAASKQEAVCGSILALCLLYTVGHVLVQLAF